MKCLPVSYTHLIPEGMSPGSDTANLSVLGYNPRKYYTGRSPLEALSIGVDMKDTDVVYRCNIVTLTEEDCPYEQQKIVDHSSGEISTEDAKILMDAVCKELENDTYKFYVGTSYRHCMVSVSYTHLLKELKEHGCGRVDVTVGSALDLFGGPLLFTEILSFCS